MGPGSWNRRLGPAALPDRPYANRSPGLFWMVWLFLQPNNSQGRNCQIRNTRISTESVTPHVRNPRKPRQSSQSRSCHLFHLFYQVHIRLGSPPALSAVFAICTQITAIAPARPIIQRSPSALSRSSMRREHCGNFSVAHIVMRPRLSNGPGVIPAPPRRAAPCPVRSRSRGNRSPGRAVVLHARAAQSSERKVLKVRGLHIIA